MVDNSNNFLAYLAVTEEGSFWNVGKDWIVAAGLTGDAS